MTYPKHRKSVQQVPRLCWRLVSRSRKSSRGGDCSRCTPAPGLETPAGAPRGLRLPFPECTPSLRSPRPRKADLQHTNTCKSHCQETRRKPSGAETPSQERCSGGPCSLDLPLPRKPVPSFSATSDFTLFGRPLSNLFRKGILTEHLLTSLFE